MKNALKSLTNRTFAILDTETNGMSATHGQIIEIGIIRVENGAIVDTYRTFLRPARGIPPFITSLTGITNSDLEAAPEFAEVALKIRELTKDAVMVAHNARFDYSFLKNEFKRLGMPWNAKTLCTVKLSRMLFPEEASHNLDSLIARHGLSVPERHRAYDDAHALWQFLEKLDRTVPHEIVNEAIDGALGNHTLPSTLDPYQIERLPHTPGVYLFYDEAGTLLYVGKSIDIKVRVKSHFAGDHLSGKEREMCNEVATIEYQETAGELGALLLESKLVKEHSPVYNRALRKAKKLALVRSRTDAAGYTTLSVAYEEEFKLTDRDCVGMFKSLAQAKGYMRKVTREHELCPKLVGLEKANGACFSAQLGRCRGACGGQESLATYNARVLEAFAGRIVKSWPYRGTVMVKEDTGEDEGVAYLIDTWRLVGVWSYSGGEYAEESFEDAVFDYDTYKILSRFILKNPKRVEPYVPDARLRSEEAVIA